MTLLDCRAAFDTCRHDLRFHGVLYTGVPAIIERALVYSYREHYAWVRWGQSRSDTLGVRNGNRQGPIASPVLWSVQRRTQMTWLSLSPQGMLCSRCCMCVRIMQVYIIFTSVQMRTQQSRKLMHLYARKPVSLRLCGQNLPWVESATHLGHELHQNGSMEHDAKVARARYIDQTVEVRQSFSLASPVEVLHALQVYLLY